MGSQCQSVSLVQCSVSSMAGVGSVQLPKDKTDREELCRVLTRIFSYLDKDEDGLVAVEDLLNYFEDAGIELGEAQLESLLSVGDEQGRIGLSFLQSQAASPGLYSLLRCRAGDLTKNSAKEVKKVE